MQDYYSRYLPQISLAVFIPLLILITIFPINWVAGAILLTTAPLIPLFMVLVGMGAADANRRNFVALARLRGNFLDRLRGLDSLRLFNRAVAETAQIAKSSEDFRSRTMEVLRLAFLSQRCWNSSRRSPSPCWQFILVSPTLASLTSVATALASRCFLVFLC